MVEGSGMKEVRVVLELSDAECAIVEKWIDLYLSSGMPPTPMGAIHDMLKRIDDDMSEMAEGDT